ncbi:MAG: ATP-binding cassette domain-containing protein [Chloroflexota bacterium]|nr:ATP-binding cassette domain-containing protein [Chloroflexota bacterium]
MRSLGDGPQGQDAFAGGAPSQDHTSHSRPAQDSGRLQLRDLWVDLEEFHLREIELDVAAGEYFVVLGPTGAGKTVLLETIAGLFQPHRGHVFVDGEDITVLPPERRGIGFVYQDYALFPHLNVAENIAFGLRLNGFRSGNSPLDVVRRLARRTGWSTEAREATRHRVEDMSRLLSIDHLLHRYPKTLSGGEQQRVALARALVVEPRLMLLDEPLSALDPETREGLQRELARIHRDLGTTTLHVTHDFEEAIALGDRIAVVREGRVVQVGEPEDIFRRPADEFVARFVGVRNIFPGEIEPTDRDGFRTVSLDGLDVAAVTERTGSIHASLRPEDIVLSLAPLRSSARNCFRGRIVAMADRSTLIHVTVRVPPDFTCVITRRSLEEMELREGKEVHIAFKASAVHIF